MSSRAPKTTRPLGASTPFPIEPAAIASEDAESASTFAAGPSQFSEPRTETTPEDEASESEAAPDQQMAPAATAGVLNEETIRRMIAEAAYYKAELRNFEPGHEVDDWIAAESEFILRLAAQ